MTLKAKITVNGLRAQRRTPSVIVIKFLKSIQRKPTNEYLWVFEGQDIKYYAHRIEQFTGNPARNIFVADGRENVLTCLRSWQGKIELRNELIAFFVDRDVITPPQSQNLYITPNYSIENFYVSEQAFERLLLSLFGLAEMGRANERLKTIEMYRRWSTQFSNKLIDLMAWLYIQQHHLGESSKSLNLKNVSLAKLFEIKMKGKRLSLTNKFGVRRARIFFPNAPAVTSNTLEMKKAELVGTDWMSLGRGKYWAEFYVKIVNYLIRDSNSQAPKVFQRKHNVGINVGANNLLEILTSYADTPTCLRTFLTARA